MLMQMLRSRAFPYVLLVIALLAIAYLRDRNAVIKEDNVRLKGNATTAIELVKLNDSTTAAKVKAYQLKLSEIKASSEADRNSYAATVAELKGRLNEMGLKPFNMEVGVVATVTATDTTTGVPDRPAPVIPDTLRYMFFTRHDSSIVTIYNGRAVKVSRYHVSPTLLITSEAKRNRNNRPHWLLPRARWLWGSQRYYTLILDLPNATTEKLNVIENQQ